MADSNPHKRNLVIFFRLAVLGGCVMEVMLALIVFLIGFRCTPCYVFMSIPLIFHAFRFFAMAMAITEKRPWKIAASESPVEPEKLIRRRRNPLFVFFGFSKQFSCARSFCGTRDFHGFYGLWCFFAKLVHQSLYLLCLVAYILTIIFVSFSYWTIPRLLLAQIITVFATAYYDYYVSDRIVKMTYEMINYVHEEKPTGDPLLLEIINK